MNTRTIFIMLTMIMSVSIFAADPARSKTIARITSQRPDLSNFVKVLEKSEVGSQLSERTNVQYTVFAPNNKAFKALPPGAIDTLLSRANDDRLEEVCNYYLLNLEMVSRQFQSINYKQKTNGKASFTGEVIYCSNRIVYVIDKVLTPTRDDIFQILQKDGRFEMFTKAITASRQDKLFQNEVSL